MFTSLGFIIVFLPVVFYGLALTRRHSRDAAVAWLFLASLTFYGLTSPRHLPLLIASIMINFFISRRISSSDQTRNRRAWLVVGLTFNLGLLAVFKYAGFLVSAVATAAGQNFEPWPIVLPVGISFYTFTQVAFLVDHYRSASASQTLPQLGLFVAYFPHLVAGPVIYHRQIIPQFAAPRFAAFEDRDLIAGALLFVLGLAKKLLIADSLAPISDGVFTTVRLDAVLTIWEAWIGLIAYSLQLYFDFSGYSDMAIGFSLMMGVTIPANFNSPYRATSLIDFWRRWHISLSAFLRSYLYIPLGGNRTGATRRYVNVLITMVLGGLWHGAGWGFLVWGAIHGVAIVSNQAYRDWRGPVTNESLPVRLLKNCTGWLATMLVVVQAWAFFRADSITAAWRLLTTAWGIDGIGLPHQFSGGVARWNATIGFNLFNADGGFLSGTISTLFSERHLLMASIVIVVFLPNSQTCVHWILTRVWPSRAVSARLAIAGIAVVAGLILGICMLAFQRNSPFIYGNF